MIWLDNIYQLQYYSHTAPVPCYCEQLVFSSDLNLQSPPLNTLATDQFSLEVKVYSADGLTLLEDATSFFSYYFFGNGGLKYFNLMLNSLSPAMCDNSCFILKVIAYQDGNTIFSKFTERYCSSGCCDVPREIVINQEGVGLINSIDAPAPASPPGLSTTGPCGEGLVRLYGSWPCKDEISGHIYGLPTVVYDDHVATFGTGPLVNFVGRIVQRPREIKTTHSYNCKLQRAESFIPYLLESLDWKLFPAWKMTEIENMLHAPYLLVYDWIKIPTEYKFAGGTAFKQISPCWELFKLETTLQSCDLRQITNCDTPCEGGPNSLHFLVSARYSDGGFYNENRLLIANDYDQLLTWYRGQDGVTSVTDTSGEYSNTDHSFVVEGGGYIPTSFYYDSPAPRNRVYGTSAPESPASGCALAVLGTPTITEDVCAAAVLGSATITNVDDTEVDISNYGNWVADGGSKVFVSGNIGRLTMTLFNNVAVANPEPVIFGNEIVGIIAVGARPAQTRVFTSDTCAQIPVDSYLAIMDDGSIRWSGLPTTQDVTGSEIEIISLYYEIN